MNRKIIEFALNAIADRVGLSVLGKIIPCDEGDFCEFVPIDGHPNETFVVRFRLGWRSAQVSFIAGNFAGPMILSMGKCGEEARQTFTAFANGVAARKIKVLMRVNGIEVDPSQPCIWAQDWSFLELSLKLTPIMVEPNDEAQLEGFVLDLVVPLFAMIATLIGVEENEFPTMGETEGRAVQSLTTRYERKKVNREACIQLKGLRCSVCGFDFAEKYGRLGVGYVEIHHIKPLASLGIDYRINVSTELEPLCANCHAMVHREEPPIAVLTLRQIVEERQKKQL